MSQDAKNAFPIFHPTEVTPMVLASALANCIDKPQYALRVMGLMYRKMRLMPAFQTVTDWDQVDAIFKGEDNELILNMGTLVIETLDAVVSPVMASEMRKGYVDHMSILTQHERMQKRLMIDIDLARLSDEEAQKLLDSCTIDSTREIIEEMRKTRFPSLE